MDLLKRKAAADDFGGKGFVRRLEQKQLQKVRDEHRRKLLVVKAPEPSRTPASAAAAAAGPSGPGAAAEGPGPSSSGAVAASASPPALDLPRHEVAQRFHAVLNCGLFDGIDNLDMAKGQTIEFLRDMIEMHERHKAAMLRGDSADGGAAGDSADDEGDDDDSERMNSNFQELCDEDRILVFFKRLLNDWKQKLDAMTELEKQTTDGKLMVATFNQSVRDLSPLFDFCRKKVLPLDMRQALLLIVECCMKHDYSAATEQYIKLSIGNSPYPIGVRVGIHDRCGREKVISNHVFHIMNDETTRRYLQSIKRLMTISQPSYPGQP